MDAFLSGLIAMLPVGWQPYVIVLLIIAYVVTKWRSNKKTAFINAQKTNKEIKKVGMVELAVNFLF